MDGYINQIIYDIKTADKHYANTLATVLLSVSFCLALIFSLDHIYDLLRQPLLELIDMIDPAPQDENAVRETVSMLTSIIFSALAILLPTLPLCLLRGRTPKAVCAPPSKKPNVNIFAYIPFALGMGYLASLAANLLFGESSRFAESSVGFSPSSVYGVILYFIYIAVLPAITEEILFRGVIMGALMPYGKTQALVISSVLFGLTHVNPIQAIFATVLGLVIGELYARTDSIWWGSLIHFLNNAVSAAITLLLQFGARDAIIFSAVFGVMIEVIILFALAYSAILITEAIRSRKKVDISLPRSNMYRTVKDAIRQMFTKSSYAMAIFCAAYIISLIYRYFI